MPDAVIASPPGWLVASPIWPKGERTQVKLVTWCVIGWRIPSDGVPVPITADGEPTGTWLTIAPDGWVSRQERGYPSVSEAEADLQREWEEDPGIAEQL